MQRLDGFHIMEKQLRDKLEYGRYLIRNLLGGVEMTDIQAEHHLFIDGISQIEFMRSNGIGLHTNSKELGLNSIGHQGRILLIGEDLIQGIFQQGTVLETVYGHIL